MTASNFKGLCATKIMGEVLALLWIQRLRLCLNLRMICPCVRPSRLHLELQLSGATWEPVENLKLDVDLYNFDFTDVIIAENFQAVTNLDPLDPTRVVRNAGGSIVQVNTNFVNASSVQTQGVDYGISYEADLGVATLVPFIQGTYVIDYDLEDPQAGSVDGAGNRNFTNFGTSVPKHRFNTGFNLLNDTHRLDVFGRYIDSYDDDQNDGQEIDSHFTVDARYSLKIGQFVDVLVLKAVCRL